MIKRQKIDFSPGSLARRMIQNEFKELKWKPFRDWFFKTFDEQDRKILAEEFYTYLNKINERISFVIWFIHIYCSPYISVLEREYTLSNGDVLKIVYPPQGNFQIRNKEKTISFSAFSKLYEDTSVNTVDYVNNITKRQNYTNLYLNVLGEQIISIHNKIGEILDVIKKSKQEDKGKEKVMITPSLQPPPEIKDFKLESQKDLEILLCDKLRSLKLNTLNTEIKDNMSELDSDGKSEFNLKN